MGLVSFLPPLRIPIPHEPGEWIAFRKPSSTEVQAARDAEEAKGRRSVRDFGVEIVKAMQSDNSDDPTGEKAQQRMLRLKKLAKDSLYDKDNFDRAVLAKASIAGWSYRDPQTGEPVPVSQSPGDQMDEETADWWHGEVVNRIKPSQEADKSAPTGGAPAPQVAEEVSAAV
jgi:hypothetical protein